MLSWRLVHFLDLFCMGVDFFQANALAPNWGQTIFQSANEIAANAMFRDRLNEVQAQTDSEKQWWERRRASVTAEKELNGSSLSEQDSVLVEGGGPGSPSVQKSKK